MVEEDAGEALRRVLRDIQLMPPAVDVGRFGMRSGLGIRRGR